MNICTDYGFLHAIYIIKLIIKIIKVLVPVLLLIKMIIDVSKYVINSDSNAKIINSCLNKFIVGALIFFIPTIINAIFKVIPTYDDKSFLTCYKNVDNYASYKVEKRVATTPTANPENVVVSKNGLSSSNYISTLNSMSTPSIAQLTAAANANGFSFDYLKIIIGTTQREGYAKDPYLYYGWASALINYPVTIAQMQGWDPSRSGDTNYYSQANINKGYASASSDVLKSVYLALTQRNTKIIECNGMYKSTPSSYNLLYKSSVYNISIYEKK